MGLLSSPALSGIGEAFVLGKRERFSIHLFALAVGAMAGLQDLCIECNRDGRFGRSGQAYGALGSNLIINQSVARSFFVKCL